MAINKSKKKSEVTLPAPLDDLLQRGFTEQFMSSHYEDAFKATKAEVQDYLETNTDGFNVDKGVGFKSEYGSVIYTGRENLKIDTDKVIALVESGQLNLAQVLSSVSSWKKEALKGTLAGHYDDIVEISETEYLTFRSSGEFKAQCAAALDPQPAVEVVKPSPTKPKGKLVATGVVTEEKITLRVDAAEVARAAAENAKRRVSKAKPAKSADADLDAILKGK